MIYDNYEISLWTHNDNFSAILGATGAYYLAEGYSPVYNYTTDGEEVLTFNIPIKYIVRDSDTFAPLKLSSAYLASMREVDGYGPAINCYLPSGERTVISPYIITNDQGYTIVDNSQWHSFLTTNNLLANEKKVKLIFDKGTANERIREFVITNLTQERDEENVYCKVECNGLAFYELGKSGYNLTFNEDTVLLEENEDNPVIYTTLNYWMDKVFPAIENTGKNAWGYSVAMDYTEIFVGANTTKVYEEPGIISWTGAGTTQSPFVPVYRTALVEKCRPAQVEKSNKYNICQDLAELFGVYVRIEYEHTDVNNPYKITNRQVIFYNRPYSETEYAITYGDNETSIRKISDSKEIVTKLYVENIESEFSKTGLISISDASANKSKDNFLLNFNYYRQAGMLSEAQKDAIDGDRDRGIIGFEDAMRIKNTALEIQFVEKYSLENDKLDLKVKIENAVDSAKAALDIANNYEDKLLGLDNTIPDHNRSDSEMAYTVLGTSPNQYINFRRDGISSIGFHLYKLDDTELIFDTHYSFIRNTYNNVTGVIFVGGFLDTGVLVHCAYTYDLFSYYTNEKTTYIDVYNSNTLALITFRADLVRIDAAIVACDAVIATLINEKQTLVINFDMMMGYFLKEGSWSASDYLSPNEQKVLPSVNFVPDSSGNKLYYDLFPRKGELLAHYTVGMVEQYNNYIELTGITTTNIETMELIEKNASGAIVKRYLYDGYFKPQYCKFTSGNPINIRPVLILNQAIALGNNNTLHYGAMDITGNYRVGNAAAHEVVYRRVQLPDIKLLTNTIEVIVGTTLLNEFDDYSTFTNQDLATEITLKMNNNLPFGLTSIRVNYKSDRTVEQLYYDAREVSIRSAFPDAKYEVDFVYLQKAINQSFFKAPYQSTILYEINDMVSYNNMIYKAKQSTLNNSPINTTYWDLIISGATAQSNYKFISTNLNNDIELSLASVVRINDAGLELRGVKGVVSEITLHLDEPSENSFTIQNYKTRFEDIFSRMIASTEQMNARSAAYERAATAITPDGGIIGSVLQNAINNNNIYFTAGVQNNIIFGRDGLIVENIIPYSNGVRGQVFIKGGGIYLSNCLDSSGLNRIYTAAITPNGINAAVISTGRLDTEKVNIYSGDQLRFTWNAEGLFAYKEKGLGSTDFNNFVRYNENGLFLVKRAGELTVNRVEVSWEGFILRNDTDTRVFFADPDTGNLTLTGTIKATGGIITGSVTVSGSLGTPDFDNSPLGNGWRIDGDGSAVFNNVYVRGTISASVFEYDKISAVGGSLYVAPTLITMSSSLVTINEDKYRFAIYHGFSTIVSANEEEAQTNWSVGRDWLINDVVSLQGCIIQYHYNTILEKYEPDAYELKDVRCKIIDFIDNHPNGAHGIILETDETIDAINHRLDYMKWRNEEDEQYTYSNPMPIGEGLQDKLESDAKLIYWGTAIIGKTLRRGIYMTAALKRSPFIDVLDSTENNPNPKVRLGNLTGITDTWFGPNPLEGYGLYSQNVFLTGTMLFVAADGSAMKLSGAGFQLANATETPGNWNWRTFGSAAGFTADEIKTGILRAGVIKILGTEQFYWDADNIYITDTTPPSLKQIRIGRYDGTNYGIGFTTDGGYTWETAVGFDGGHLGGVNYLAFVDGMTSEIGKKNKHFTVTPFGPYAVSDTWTQLSTGKTYVCITAAETGFNLSHWTLLETVISSFTGRYADMILKTGMKVGDLWLIGGESGANAYTNGRTYYCISGLLPGAGSWVLMSSPGIKGASIVWDADTGNIGVTAGEKITILSGGTLEMTADNLVTIGTGGSLNMVGSTINLNTPLGANAISMDHYGITLSSNAKIRLESPDGIELSTGLGLETSVSNHLGQQISIQFTEGTILDVNNTQATFIIKIHHNGADVTDLVPASLINWYIKTPSASTWTTKGTGVKTITLVGGDVDFQSTLRCVIGEYTIVLQAWVENGQLIVQDLALGGETAYFSLYEGELLYSGSSDYHGANGKLFADLSICGMTIDVQISNLYTSRLSIHKDGINIRAVGKLIIEANGEITINTGGKIKLTSADDMEISTGKSLGVYAQESITLAVTNAKVWHSASPPTGTDFPSSNILPIDTLWVNTATYAILGIRPGMMARYTSPGGWIPVVAGALATSFISITDRDIIVSSGGNLIIDAPYRLFIGGGQGLSTVNLSNGWNLDGITSNGGYFLYAGSTTPATAPFSVKMDGTITNVGNSYVQTVTDNASNTLGVKLYVFFPQDVSAVDKCLLSVKFSAFRAYSTGASSGGGQTSGGGGAQTSSTVESIEKTSYGGSGNTGNEVGTISVGEPTPDYETSAPLLGTSTTGNSSGETGIGSPTPDYDTSGPSDNNTGDAGTGDTGTEKGHTHGSGSYTVTAYGTNVTGYSDVPSASHKHTGPSHSHGPGIHTHTFGHGHLLTAHNHPIGSHTHAFGHGHLLTAHSHTVGTHSHKITIDAHNHTIDNHTHTVENHTHGITYGIFEPPYSTPWSCTVFVDGVPVAALTAIGEFASYDIANYFSKTGTPAKIIREAFHTVEIRPNDIALARIAAHLYIKTTQISKVAGVL